LAGDGNDLPLAQVGETERALIRMEPGLAAYRATSAELWLPYFLALVADVHAESGQPSRGLCLLDDALAMLERTGEHWCTAEPNRLRGELLLLVPDPNTADAELTFRRALAVARGQDARLWELRAATSLARLWREQDKCGEGRDLLAPVYGWFTEGFDTADLKDAKALLDELA
jgi:predicted ATPase